MYFYHRMALKVKIIDIVSIGTLTETQMREGDDRESADFAWTWYFMLHSVSTSTVVPTHASQSNTWGNQSDREVTIFTQHVMTRRERERERVKQRRGQKPINSRCPREINRVKRRGGGGWMVLGRVYDTLFVFRERGRWWLMIDRGERETTRDSKIRRKRDTPEYCSPRKILVILITATS